MLSYNSICSYTTAFAGLFFTLNGEMYQPGEAVLITNIGSSTNGPGSTSLACVTTFVNTDCCRVGQFEQPATMIANWTFPNGDIVSRLQGSITASYSFDTQIRLVRRDNTTSPTGTYECRVRVGDTKQLMVASITLTTG